MRARAFLVMMVLGWSLSCGGDDDGSTGGGGGGTGGGGAMTCGNGVREGAEKCDGNDLGMSTCMSLNLGMGVLSCNPTTCIYNTTMCGTMAPVGGTGG